MVSSFMLKLPITIPGAVLISKHKFIVMKPLLFTGLTLFLTFLISCEKLDTEVTFDLVLEDQTQGIEELVVPVGKKLNLKTGAYPSPLKQRVDYTVADLPGYEINYESEVQIRPSRLSASYISFKDEFLFVSVHEQGEDFDGAMLAIYFDRDRLDRASRGFQLRTNGQDLEWNALFIDDSNPALTKAIFAGDNPTVGSVLHEVSLEFRSNGDIRLDDQQRIQAFYGQSANSVLRSGSQYYMTAGGSERGGVFTYNINEGSKGAHFIQTHMKFIADNGNGLLGALKGGPNAEFFVFDISDGFNTTPLRSIGLNPITPELGKNTIWLEGNKAFLALGQSGFAVIDDITSSTSATYITGTREEACNAVTADANFIYLAYDQYVEFLDKETYQSYGWIDFDGDAESINYVTAFEYRGNYCLAVADKENVRILTLEED